MQQTIKNVGIVAPDTQNLNTIYSIILKFVFVGYNLCSFSLYFISSTFFLYHIGMEAPPFHFVNGVFFLNTSLTNLIVLVISATGCLFLVGSQQCNLYRKAMKFLYNSRTGVKNSTFLNIGISYKAIVQLTSFFSFVYDHFPLPMALLIAGVVGIGLFKATYHMESPILNKQLNRISTACYYSISYSLCISALYFNTFDHITLSILNESQRVEGQILLFLPNIFFTAIFFLGVLVLYLEKTHNSFFTLFMRNKLGHGLYSVYSGVAVTWKSIINSLSFLSLLSLFLIKSDDALLFIGIPLFLLIAFSQFIFFE